MGNRNEPGFLRHFLQEYPMSGWLESLDSGRILNVGSLDSGFNRFYDQIFTDREVLGIDMEPGKGVNLVCNMEGDCKELNGEKFAMVICASMLEHCSRPWIAAQNIEDHLMPFGLLYISVPWIWRTHNYPKDYWRISPEAVKILFPHIQWKRISHSTQMENEFIKQGEDHDQNIPWRIIWRGRAYITVQQVHMIGRMN